ncbi:class D beta-lactamase [Pseudorhizobium halotolerans]|uniref:Class D beta-lactamase n=1 Tax=Pseudorhizobium halotolerans TaxID=1233081 RepID=A0ABN7JTN0_9HYPH|nr:class D beta-lactamase [Pseudorhizobium halotolerans]CAD7046567.1 class D beta-lactamase [Pseudorhizobium halotolerans]
MILERRSLLATAIGVLAAFIATGPASAAGPIRCTVVVDAESGEAIHRQGACDERVYPMSTFKLPLAMMGYDAGILTDEKTPRWDYQAKFGGPARVKKAFDPTGWERESIVWYSQEITRRLGEDRFGDYVKTFAYGNADVSGGPGKLDGLTESWLMSSLKISPDEQVDFLRRFLKRELPLSDHAVAMTQAITPRFEAADGWVIHGKTGSGRMRYANGKPRSDRPIGWFVGWAEREGRELVFARLLVDAKPHDEPISFVVRDSLIEDLPGLVADR